MKPAKKLKESLSRVQEVQIKNSQNMYGNTEKQDFPYEFQKIMKNCYQLYMIFGKLMIKVENTINKVIEGQVLRVIKLKGEIYNKKIL